MPQDATLDFEDSFDLTDEKIPVPTAALWLAVALLVAFPPLAGLAGLCEWMPGSRSAATTMLYAGAYFAVIVGGLVVPYARFVAPPLEKYSPVYRLLMGTVFLALPLLSFGNFLGTFRDRTDWLDLAMIVVPSAAIAALLIERAKRTYLASAFLGVTTFVGFFVAGDFLGPYKVAASYASNGPEFYFLRAIFPPLAFPVVLAAFAHKDPLPHRLRGFRRAIACLLVGTAAFQLLPAFLQWRGTGEPLGWSVLDFRWLTFPFISYLLAQPLVSAYRRVVVLSVLAISLDFAAIAVQWHRNEVDLVALCAITQAALSLGVFAGILWTLLEKPTRGRYSL